MEDFGLIWDPPGQGDKRDFEEIHQESAPFYFIHP